MALRIVIGPPQRPCTTLNLWSGNASRASLRAKTRFDLTPRPAGRRRNSQSIGGDRFGKEYEAPNRAFVSA